MNRTESGALGVVMGEKQERDFTDPRWDPDLERSLGAGEDGLTFSVNSIRLSDVPVLTPFLMT